MFVATKLTTTDSERGIDHVLRRVSKLNDHTVVDFRDRVDFKPNTSVIYFKPSGPRCLVVKQFMGTRATVTPIDTEFPDRLLFEGDAPNEPPRVCLESVDISSILYHVVEEQQYLDDAHDIQTERQCHHHLPMSTRGTQEDGSSSVRRDLRTADGRGQDEEKASTLQPSGARTCIDRCRIQVGSSTSRLAREPTTSAGDRMSRGAEKHAILRDIARQFTVEELVNALTECFPHDDVRRAFETTERQTTASTVAATSLDDQSVQEERPFKMASRVEMHRQSSVDILDPLFCLTESAASITEETRDAAKSLSNPPAKMTRTSIFAGDGMEHRSQAETEEWGRPDDALSKRHYEKKDIDARVTCHRIDSSSLMDEKSVAETAKTGPEESTWSTKIGRSSVTTLQDGAGPSSKGSQQRSILPLKLKKRSENRHKPCLEDEMSDSTSSTGDEKPPCPTNVKTPNDDDAQLLQYAEYGVSSYVRQRSTF